MMKFRFPPGNLPNPTNPHRPIPSNTLHIRHNNSILLCYPYLPRRELRLNHPIHTRKRSFNVFYLLIYARRTRLILRVLHFSRNMEYWSNPSAHSNSHSIYRIRPTMRTNIILRSNSHHQPLISNPIHRHKFSRMNLRRILSRQSNPYPILRFPFYPSIYHHSNCHSPPTIPPRNRLQQPNRNFLRRRQNPIPPLLYH
uniref:(northern house mosquito) hypothetical protein n=1 Tax=Culex pipiens TaxID=7175 RepID=A0A8D8ACU0_CULPI